MAVIKIKRGTTVPTTSNLTQVGEMALNTSTNEVYIRGSSSVVKLGGGLTLLYDGGAAIPSTLSTNNINLKMSLNLLGRMVAFEVRAVTGTDTYETHVVFATLGTNSTTSVSATYDRLFSWSTFDGQYFKTHSFKAYCSNSVTSYMSVGYVKHLIGNFNGNSILWTTNTSTIIYLEKIWLVN